MITPSLVSMPNAGRAPIPARARHRHPRCRAAGRAGRKNVERSLGRKRVLQAAKHRGAVGSPAQAAGEAEKAELGHRAQFQMAWISVRDPTNITTAPGSAQLNSILIFDLRLLSNC